MWCATPVGGNRLIDGTTHIPMKSRKTATAKPFFIIIKLLYHMVLVLDANQMQITESLIHKVYQ